jgi:glutamine synthetase
MLGRLNQDEKKDIAKIISERDVKILNLCHIPEDGRLKTLSFAASGSRRIKEILEFGERVDGSSLFSCIDPDRSDIYIMPKPETAFFDPFCSMPSLNILCRYLSMDGKPLDIAPETILTKAEGRLRATTGVALRALAELEFYIIAKQENEPLFPSVPETHYQESAPFSKFENVRDDIVVTLASIGIDTKYGHAEVGKIEEKNGTVMEQHEVELMPQNPIEMAETIAVTKWVVRNVCSKYNTSVSFSPKIVLEHAGNGMHIHLCGLKKNKNIISEPNGSLSVEAKQMIGGILKFASSLTAFSNPIPVSYLRFASRRESPMQICWGARDRLALIRVPLWWEFKKTKDETYNCKRTFEFRAPDPAANAYMLLAGMAIAIKYGLENPREAIRIAKELHLRKIGKEKRLKVLPRCCSESAMHLDSYRKYYEADDVFPKGVIDNTIKRLKSFNDKVMFQELKSEPRKIEQLMKEYLHYG